VDLSSLASTLDAIAGIETSKTRLNKMVIEDAVGLGSQVRCR